MWVDIREFPDYQVSPDGQVRSFRVRCDYDQAKPVKARKMKGFIDVRGYHSVMLRLPGHPKPYRRLVHRLVAEAYLLNPFGLSDVAHNNGRPTDNRVENLRWATHADNQMDMPLHGTMQDGEKSCTAKLTAAQVKSIRQEAALIGRGSGIYLARKFGISKAQVSRIVNGSRWKSTLG